MTTIRAVPKTYAGVRFRSTLEADWAYNLDHFGIVWQYEPEAVQLPSGTYYRPDFYLPDIETWLEVKGPHDERIGKAIELSLSDDSRMVVVGRAPVRGFLAFEVPGKPFEKGDIYSHLPFLRCKNCQRWQFFRQGRSFCRACPTSFADVDPRSCIWPGETMGPTCRAFLRAP